MAVMQTIAAHLHHSGHETHIVYELEDGRALAPTPDCHMAIWQSLAEVVRHGVAPSFVLPFHTSHTFSVELDTLPSVYSGLVVESAARSLDHTPDMQYHHVEE